MSKDRRAKIVAAALDISYAHAFRLTRQVMEATTQRFEIDELVTACRVKYDEEQKRAIVQRGFEAEKRGEPQ